MTIYKKIKIGKQDRFMRQREREPGKFSLISKVALTPSVLRILESMDYGVPYSDSPEADKPPTPPCIFCDQPSTHQKYIFGQMVALCQDDFQNKTTGEIGQKVKEMSNEQDEVKKS